MACVPYVNVVGTLMYVVVGTRLDIGHAVGVMRRYITTPRKEHWIAIKRVFRYLCGTIDIAMCYHGNF